MNDRALKVLEQYDLEVTGTRRGRGSYIFDTPQGIRILMDYTGSEHKAQFQNRLLAQVRECGYEKVDVILPNKEGSLISKDWEENKYVVKEWYAGRECDTANEAEVLEAVRNLARLHKFMHLEISGEQTEKIQAQKKERRQNIVKAEDDTDEAALPDEPETDEERILGFEKSFTAQPPLAEIHAQNAELRKIRTFIRKRNDKGAFERLFLQCCSSYFEQAAEAEERLSQSFGMQTITQSAARGSVCHGDYDHHHVLLSGSGVATVNFEYCRFDYQVSDLYRFLRKILEKHDWNPRLGMRILDAYQQIRPFSEEERKLLYIRMLYPEKFRKLANHYYGGNKAWISRRFLDKLELLNLQQEKKEKFVKMLKK